MKDTMQDGVPYEAPAVVYEAELEVQAGSPIGGLPDPLNDITGTE